MDETIHQPQDLISRRSMMFKGAALGVGATAVGRLLVDPPDVFAKGPHQGQGRPPYPWRRGDPPLPRAAEIIESDLWQQYNELAGIQDGEVPGGSWQRGIYRGRRGTGRGHERVHPRQHRRRVQPRRLHQRLPGGARRESGQPRQVPDAAEQPGGRRPEDRRTADQPDAVERRHQLLDALSERHSESRTSATPCHRPSRPWPSASIRRFPATTAMSTIPTTCRRSPIRPVSTSPSSSRAVRASTPRWRSGSPVRRCCGSCSASAAARSCTSRPGKTKPAMRLP